MLNQPRLPQFQHFLRRVSDFKQCPRGFVDPRIGGLRTQRHGDDKRVDIHMIKLAHRRGISRLKPLKNFPNGFIIKLLYHSGGICRLIARLTRALQHFRQETGRLPARRFLL